MEIITTEEIDTGFITHFEELEDGYTIVIQEPLDDFELGFQVYKDDLPGLFLSEGDKIEIEGHGSKFGIRRFIFNGITVFDRSLREAELLYEIRRREREIRVLRFELNTISG